MKKQREVVKCLTYRHRATVAIGPLTEEQADVLLRLFNRRSRDWFTARYKEVPRADGCRELSIHAITDLVDRILNAEELLLKAVK